MKPEFIHQIIDSQVFALEVVIDAAYWLINRLAFRIEGDPNKEIWVRIKPRFEEISPKQAQILFDEKLIDSFITRYKWSANSKIRLHFIHAALSFTPNEADIWALRDKDEILNSVDYHIFQDANQESMVLSLDLQVHKLEALLPRLFSGVKPLLSIAHFTEFRVKDAKLTFRVKPKNNFQMNELKARLHSNFEALPYTNVF